MSPDAVRGLQVAAMGLGYLLLVGGVAGCCGVAVSAVVAGSILFVLNLVALSRRSDS